MHHDPRNSRGIFLYLGLLSVLLFATNVHSAVPPTDTPTPTATFTATPTCIHPAISIPPPAEGQVSYLFPNPATGNKIWICYQLPSMGKAVLNLYNTVADPIARYGLSGSDCLNVQELDISRFSNGIYYGILTLDSAPQLAGGKTLGVSKMRPMKFTVARHR